MSESMPAAMSLYLLIINWIFAIMNRLLLTDPNALDINSALYNIADLKDSSYENCHAHNTIEGPLVFPYLASVPS